MIPDTKLSQALKELAGTNMPVPSMGMMKYPHPQSKKARK